MQATGTPGHYLIMETADIRWELWLRQRPRIIQVSAVDQRITGAFWCFESIKAASVAASELDGVTAPNGWVSKGGAALTSSVA